MPLFHLQRPCRILRELDFNYTPQHGSGRKIVESACAVVSTQGLDRRLRDQETARHPRHAAKASLEWRLTTAQARRTLQHLYPL